MPADSHAKIFSCDHESCRKSFSTKRNLLDHLFNHQGPKPHVCDYRDCKKSFLRPAHLLIHRRTHTGEKPFVCPQEGCGKTWTQHSALKQHLRSHTGEKPYKCSFRGCRKAFSTSSGCKRHFFTHDKPNKHPWECDPFALFSFLENQKQKGIKTDIWFKKKHKSLNIIPDTQKMKIDFLLNSTETTEHFLQLNWVFCWKKYQNQLKNVNLNKIWVESSREERLIVVDQCSHLFIVGWKWMEILSGFGH